MNLLSHKKLLIYIVTVFTFCTMDHAVGMDMSIPEFPISPSSDKKKTNRSAEAKAEADRIIAKAEEEAEYNRTISEAKVKAEKIKTEAQDRITADATKVISDRKADAEAKQATAPQSVPQTMTRSYPEIATAPQSVPQTMTRSYPEIARGYEAIYDRFMNGRLVYKGPAGERSFLISDVVNSSLEGEFNLNGLTFTSGITTYNISDYLRIKLGHRKTKENENKTTVWIVPQFVASGVGSSFSAAPWSSDIGIFWTWGKYDATDFDYLTSMQFNEISAKNLDDLAACGGRLRTAVAGCVGGIFPLFLIKF